MKLTPEEEAIFDEHYQVLIDAYGLAGDFLKTHKPEIKGLVEKVKDHLAGVEPLVLAPPMRPSETKRLSPLELHQEAAARRAKEEPFKKRQRKPSV